MRHGLKYSWKKKPLHENHILINCSKTTHTASSSSKLVDVESSSTPSSVHECHPYLFIGGLGADNQHGVVAKHTNYGPHGEKGEDSYDNSAAANEQVKEDQKVFT